MYATNVNCIKMFKAFPVSISFEILTVNLFFRKHFHNKFRTTKNVFIKIDYLILFVNIKLVFKL